MFMNEPQKSIDGDVQYNPGKLPMRDMALMSVPFVLATIVFAVIFAFTVVLLGFVSVIVAPVLATTFAILVFFIRLQYYRGSNSF